MGSDTLSLSEASTASWSNISSSTLTYGNPTPGGNGGMVAGMPGADFQGGVTFATVGSLSTSSSTYTESGQLAGTLPGTLGASYSLTRSQSSSLTLTGSSTGNYTSLSLSSTQSLTSSSTTTFTDSLAASNVLQTPVSSLVPYTGTYSPTSAWQSTGDHGSATATSSSTLTYTGSLGSSGPDRPSLTMLSGLASNFSWTSVWIGGTFTQAGTLTRPPGTATPTTAWLPTTGTYVLSASSTSLAIDKKSSTTTYTTSAVLQSQTVTDTHSNLSTSFGTYTESGSPSTGNDTLGTSTTQTFSSVTLSTFSYAGPTASLVSGTQRIDLELLSRSSSFLGTMGWSGTAGFSWEKQNSTSLTQGYTQNGTYHGTVPTRDTISATLATLATAGYDLTRWGSDWSAVSHSLQQSSLSDTYQGTLTYNLLGTLIGGSGTLGNDNSTGVRTSATYSGVWWDQYGPFGIQSFNSSYSWSLAQHRGATLPLVGTDPVVGQYTLSEGSASSSSDSYGGMRATANGGTVTVLAIQRNDSLSQTSSAWLSESLLWQGGTLQQLSGLYTISEGTVGSVSSSHSQQESAGTAYQGSLSIGVATWWSQTQEGGTVGLAGTVGTVGGVSFSFGSGDSWHTVAGSSWSNWSLAGVSQSVGQGASGAWSASAAGTPGSYSFGTGSWEIETPNRSLTWTQLGSDWSASGSTVSSSELSTTWGATGTVEAGTLAAGQAWTTQAVSGTSSRSSSQHAPTLDEQATSTTSVVLLASQSAVGSAGTWWWGTYHYTVDGSGSSRDDSGGGSHGTAGGPAGYHSPINWTEGTQTSSGVNVSSSYSHIQGAVGSDWSYSFSGGSQSADWNTGSGTYSYNGTDSNGTANVTATVSSTESLSMAGTANHGTVSFSLYRDHNSMTLSSSQEVRQYANGTAFYYALDYGDSWNDVRVWGTGTLGTMNVSSYSTEYVVATPIGTTSSSSSYSTSSNVTLTGWLGTGFLGGPYAAAGSGPTFSLPDAPPLDTSEPAVLDGHSLIPGPGPVAPGWPGIGDDGLLVEQALAQVVPLANPETRDDYWILQAGFAAPPLPPAPHPPAATQREEEPRRLPAVLEGGTSPGWLLDVWTPPVPPRVGPARMAGVLAGGNGGGSGQPGKLLPADDGWVPPASILGGWQPFGGGMELDLDEILGVVQREQQAEKSRHGKQPAEFVNLPDRPGAIPVEFVTGPHVLGEIAAEEALLTGGNAAQAEVTAAGGPLSQIVLGENNACFPAGFLILTSEGLKPIEQIKPGDLVYSRPENDPHGPVAVKRVKSVLQLTSAWLYQLTIAGRELRTTPTHPFAVLGQGWRPAKALQVKDLLLTDTPHLVEVEAIETLRGEFTVYNIMVEDWHTYFITGHEWGFAVWVHNVNYDNPNWMDELLPPPAEAEKSLLPPAELPNVADMVMRGISQAVDQASAGIGALGTMLADGSDWVVGQARELMVQAMLLGSVGVVGADGGKQGAAQKPVRLRFDVVDWNEVKRYVFRYEEDTGVTLAGSRDEILTQLYIEDWNDYPYLRTLFTNWARLLSPDETTKLEETEKRNEQITKALEALPPGKSLNLNHISIEDAKLLKTDKNVETIGKALVLTIPELKLKLVLGPVFNQPRTLLTNIPRGDPILLYYKVVAIAPAANNLSKTLADAYVNEPLFIGDMLETNQAGTGLLHTVPFGGLADYAITGNGTFVGALASTADGAAMFLGGAGIALKSARTIKMSLALQGGVIAYKGYELAQAAGSGEWRNVAGLSGEIVIRMLFVGGTYKGLQTVVINKGATPVRVPQPGDPDFIGPVRPPQPGEADFVGPVRPPQPGEADFVGPIVPKELPGTAPRLGPRRISDTLYEELRGATPTQEIRDMVNAGKVPPFPDEALPGLIVTKRLHADHIVSMDTITRMEGFDKLTRAQQEAVLNNPINFVGLSESANTSKGAKSYADWTRYKKGGIDVDPVFRRRMMEEEVRVARLLQQQIDDFLKK